MQLFVFRIEVHHLMPAVGHPPEAAAGNLPLVDRARRKGPNHSERNQHSLEKSRRCAFSQLSNAGDGPQLGEHWDTRILQSTPPVR